ncbi:MAG TPA: efflux RND transporter periplasmic adaptor subunit [Candidatus Eisenbacteria bacterium]|nr:efflux RND transporter periplasmic adaptor subunit [Candidatus Eisenbacteria bacterium]
MKKKKWLWIGLGVALLLVLVGVNMAAQGGKKGMAVQMARVRTEDITSKVRAPGKIEPKTQVKISADIMGKVTHLAVKEGDTVKRGQLLLQLDPVQRTADQVQARTALASAKARQRDADSKFKVAESNFQRQKALYEQKLLSNAEWDQATSTFEAAREAANGAREEVARSQAALTAATDNLSKTRIVAPIDGVVSALYIEEGEIVIMGTMNNAGTQILTVSDLSRMVVKADVDETDVVDIRLGQKAKITVDALPDSAYDGTVTEIANTAKRSATGGVVEGQTNFEVEVTFDATVSEVRPGMTADVEIETATHPKTNGVPIQAVVVRTEREIERATKKGGAKERRARRSDAVAAEEDTVGRKDKEITGVFVVREGIAKFVPVKTGIASETMIEIAGDLKPGESVVTGPYKALRELKPEQKVRQEQAGGAGGARKRG